MALDKWQFWIGGFYLDTDKDLGITTDVGGIPVLIDIDFDLLVDWNFIYGMRWEPIKNVEIVVEHGFSGRNQLVFATALRF